MRELFRIVEKPRRCSYLPHETASLDVRAVSSMTPVEYGDLLQRGYRRFGWQVFRPACGKCSQCVSIRVPAQSFAPSSAHKRVLRKNEQTDGLREWNSRGIDDTQTVHSTLSSSDLASVNYPALGQEEREGCIRCYPGDDIGTMGFFVCGFVRSIDIEDRLRVKSHQYNHSDDDWAGFSD